MVPTKQQELILNYEGNAVVIAAPGSGKTFVISEKIRNTLQNCPEHKGIIAISYTNKASSELKERCLKNGFNPKSSFFGTIDKFYIGEIIIPFGKQIWGLPKSDFEITQIENLDKTDQSNITWLDRDLTFSKITKEQISILGEFFLRGIIILESVGVLANYIFTKSLACQKYIRAKYLSIYIDEYQDAGINQHTLFESVVNLGITGVAVGDINQSIYAFSGKSSKFLASLKSKNDFKSFILNQNHRCHPSIINYSSYLLDPTVTLIETNEKRVSFYRVDGNEAKIALWLDKFIPDIVKCGIKPNQIAILTRGNRTAETINNNLKTPHRFLQTTDLDMSLNVWSGIFSKLLRYAYDPKFRFVEVIEEYISFEKLNTASRRQLLEYRKHTKDVFKTPIINEQEVVQLFTNIANFLAQKSRNKESIKILTDLLKNPTLLQTYLPTSENEVNIMTLHKSKGLEFDAVFHLDLYEWVFPTKGPGPNNDWRNPVYSDWLQDINLHYVGITRAREFCALISSSLRTNNIGETKNAKDSDFLWENAIDELRS